MCASWINHSESLKCCINLYTWFHLNYYVFVYLILFIQHYVICINNWKAAHFNKHHLSKLFVLAIFITSNKSVVYIAWTWNLIAAKKKRRKMRKHRIEISICCSSSLWIQYYFRFMCIKWSRNSHYYYCSNTCQIVEVISMKFYMLKIVWIRNYFIYVLYICVIIYDLFISTWKHCIHLSWNQKNKTKNHIKSSMNLSDLISLESNPSKKST